MKTTAKKKMTMWMGTKATLNDRNLRLDDFGLTSRITAGRCAKAERNVRLPPKSLGRFRFFAAKLKMSSAVTADGSPPLPKCRLLDVSKREPVATDRIRFKRDQ
ncbi:MAG: hypothetical protein ABSB39_17055 [Candidatus Sulfotelmatobacter sp.]|jgi:hypothetical protein